MLERIELPDGSESWRSPWGQLTVTHPAPGVVVFVERGSLDMAFAAPIEAHSDRALGEAPTIEVFVDAYDLESYDPEVRKSASQWLKRNAVRVAAQHMLVRSRLTKMGLAAVSLALGGVIHGHHERRSFDAALAAAVKRLRTAGVVVSAQG